MTRDELLALTPEVLSLEASFWRNRAEQTSAIATRLESVHPEASDLEKRTAEHYQAGAAALELLAVARRVVVTCKNCKFADWERSLRCNLEGRHFTDEEQNTETRPDWCPLSGPLIVIGG